MLGALGAARSEDPTLLLGCHRIGDMQLETRSVIEIA